MIRPAALLFQGAAPQQTISSLSQLMGGQVAAVKELAAALENVTEMSRSISAASLHGAPLWHGAAAADPHGPVHHCARGSGRRITGVAGPLTVPSLSGHTNAIPN
ncbi:MAG: hypothetical protein ABSG63_18475 [Spirochaetia bacterium]